MELMQLGVVEAFILAIGSLGLGMVLLIRGGGWTIDASVFVARHVGIPPLIVGFTIVAFGTSLPELLVSVNANWHGSPGIAIGNVLGSNIANILLVIGATATFCTILANPRKLLHDLIMMMVATVILAYLMVSGDISRTAGITMVGILIVYVFWEYMQARQGKLPVDDVEDPEFSSFKAGMFYLIAGMVCIALGAEFLVRGARVSATIIGVPEAVIGLSIIAIGTSLPELATCLIAAARKQPDLILGNIIGSNVFNILMIIGIMTSIKPIDMADVAPQLAAFDIWIVMAVSLAFSLLLLLYRKITRFIGILFLVGYAVYIAAIYMMSLSA
jgi:cation:H+ antiporter